jgi:hypothetical protein
MPQKDQVTWSTKKNKKRGGLFLVSGPFARQKETIH